MGLKSRKILGISVTTSPKREILEEIQKYLAGAANKPLIIATPNPEQIVLAQTDSHFAKLLNQADVAIPDGIGLAFAIKQKRIPGVEFMEELVAMAAGRGYAVALIGGRGGVAVAALECLSRRTAGLRGWAEEPPDNYNGYNDYNVYNCYKKLKKTETKIVFVGLGAPKQEEFIERLARQFQISNFKFQIVLMSVGGAFDMIAGRLPRAPRLMRALGLEWLWRLLRQPWRFRRQLALLKFLWLLAIKACLPALP